MTALSATYAAAAAVVPAVSPLPTVAAAGPTTRAALEGRRRLAIEHCFVVQSAPLLACLLLAIRSGY